VPEAREMMAKTNSLNTKSLGRQVSILGISSSWTRAKRSSKTWRIRRFEANSDLKSIQSFGSTILVLRALKLERSEASRTGFF